MKNKLPASLVGEIDDLMDGYVPEAKIDVLDTAMEMWNSGLTEEEIMKWIGVVFTTAVGAQACLMVKDDPIEYNLTKNTFFPKVRYQERLAELKAEKNEATNEEQVIAT